jgi:hypothetical protein
MKKSNKILIGGLLTIILILVALHIGIYAKYKNGDYVVYDENTMNSDLIVDNYTNVNRVVVSNRANTVIKLGDNTRVEQYRKSDEVKITQNGNVLMISGKDTSDQAKNSGYSVVVYVKNGTQIDFINANGSIRGSKGKEFSVLNVSSKDSYVDITDPNQALRIDSLQLNASAQSNIYLGEVQIRTLNIQLNESLLVDENAEVNQILLNADANSRIHFQSKNLLKLKTNTTVNNE